MKINFSRILRQTTLLLTAFTYHTCHAGFDPEICSNSETVIAFINGVLTTPKQAANALDLLEQKYSNKIPGSEELTYQLLYNNHDQGLADFVETFRQRLAEHDAVLADRMELYTRTLSGSGEIWDRIISAIPSASKLKNNLMLKWLPEFFKGSSERLNKTFSDSAHPDTVGVLNKHRAFISKWIFSEQKILFVAHSQGNLFLKLDYDYAMRSLAQFYGPNYIAAVHAGPASIDLKGEYSLANLDLVINGLALTGQVVPANDIIPGHLQRPAGPNGERDILGHGWGAIYFNPALSTGKRIDSAIVGALQRLAAANRPNRCDSPRREISCQGGGWWSSPDGGPIICHGGPGAKIPAAPCGCNTEMWRWGGGQPVMHVCGDYYVCDEPDY